MKQHRIDQKIGMMVARALITALLAVNVWVLLTKDSIVAQSLALLSLVILLPLLFSSFKWKLSENI